MNIETKRIRKSDACDDDACQHACEGACEVVSPYPYDEFCDEYGGEQCDEPADAVCNCDRLSNQSHMSHVECHPLAQKYVARCMHRCNDTSSMVVSDQEGQEDRVEQEDRNLQQFAG